ncbi:MAG: sigma-70 family RNA polymerase sigma factor [Candidatus Zixiibacteriota bacterium]
MNKIDTERISRLVELARLGERKAFSEIVRIMMNPVIALTYKMTRDKDSAMDLAQDTFVAAWQNLDSFKGDSKFESWIYRIATNKAINFVKRESRSAGDEALQAISAVDDPGRDLQRKELRERILAFMGQLPAQQRKIFELRFYKELPFDEVANVSGRAVGTVKTLYREAVKKLRQVAVSEGWSQ